MMLMVMMVVVMVVVVVMLIIMVVVVVVVMMMMMMMMMPTYLGVFRNRAFQRISDELWGIVVHINGPDRDSGIAIVGLLPLILRHYCELIVRAALWGVTVQ